jgi:hypothetical protein
MARGEAERASAALARVIGRPFALLPPTRSETPAAASFTVQLPPPTAAAGSAADETRPPARSSLPLATTHPLGSSVSERMAAPRARPLPANTAVMHRLPIRIDPWELARAADGTLRLALQAGWVRQRIVRGLLYWVLAVVFTVLAILSYTRGFALPQPSVLPVLGLIGAVYLLGLGLYTIVAALRRQRVIRIDPVTRSVDTGTRTLTASQLRAVVVSQVVSKVRGGAGTRTVQYAEINLETDNGFTPLVYETRLDERMPIMPAEQVVAQPISARAADSGVGLALGGSDAPAGDLLNQDAVFDLMPGSAVTAAQSAGLAIASALDVPARYDRRLR